MVDEACERPAILQLIEKFENILERPCLGPEARIGGQGRQPGQMKGAPRNARDRFTHWVWIAPLETVGEDQHDRTAQQGRIALIGDEGGECGPDTRAAVPVVDDPRHALERQSYITMPERPGDPG